MMCLMVGTQICRAVCNRSSAWIETEDGSMAFVTAIGLMSGTSYDGIDIALIETDGEQIGRLGPTGYRPYSEAEREQVRYAIAAAVQSH